MGGFNSNYMRHMKSFIKDNKGLLFILGIICTLSYGFTISHHSIGVDNFAHDLYYKEFGAISQGRASQQLLDLVFNAYHYDAFWSNFLGVVILFCATICFCILFQIVSNNRVPKLALMIFSTIFVSYPIINEHFIFLPLDLPLCYLLCALTLSFLNYSFKQKRILGLLAIISLVFCVSLNESIAMMILCGLCIMFILEFIYNDNHKIRDSIKFFVYCVLILGASIIIESLILKLLNIIINPDIHIVAGNSMLFWKYAPFSVVFEQLFYGLIYKYGSMAKQYFPIAIWAISVVFSLFYAVYYAIKRKVFLSLYI